MSRGWRPVCRARQEENGGDIGACLAGLSLARTLGGNSGFSVTLLDKRNHHLFQPLLYQVTTAARSPANIAEPIRKIVRRYPNVTVLMEEVVGVDTEARSIRLTTGGALPYDLLAIATGSAYAYFGHSEWAAVAPGLKNIDNARAIRAQ